MIFELAHGRRPGGHSASWNPSLFMYFLFFPSQPEVKDDPQGQSTEARSANEYEKLAHMCLKQKE